MHFNEFYFTEAVKPPQVMYHGRNVKSDKFDYKFVGLKDAVDQEGPGFYFSDSEQEATGYSTGGVLITAKPKFRKIISEKNRPKIKDAMKLAKMAPDLDDTLTDWGFDPPYYSREDAFNDMFDTLFVEDDEMQTYLNIWYDLYRNKPQQYVKNMVKMGYDALIKKLPFGTHVIVYNPKSFDILNVEDK